MKVVHIHVEKTSGIFSEDFTKIEVSFSLEKLEEVFNRRHNRPSR